MEKLIACGGLFVAISLAVFGVEHFMFAQSLSQAVPVWMPARLFWAYFVGAALIAAALSIAFRKYVHLSATLLSIMLFLFVLTIHLPRLAANMEDRFSWAVVLRDTSFACGALALAAQGSSRLVSWARLGISIPVIFFGVEQILHPQFAPGVPLPKVTPAWIPLAPFWGYLAGAVMIVTGAAMLVNRYPRMAAAWTGLLVVLTVVLIYVPILIRARPAEIVEAVNYVADTLLFAGTILALAGAIRAAPKFSMTASQTAFGGL